MRLHVQGEVVRSGKGLRTQGAPVRPVPGVPPVVAMVVVRPGKPPAAARPVADVGLAPRVGLGVRPQLAELVKLPSAALVGAQVDGDLPPAQLWLHLVRRLLRDVAEPAK